MQEMFLCGNYNVTNPKHNMYSDVKVIDYLYNKYYYYIASRTSYICLNHRLPRDHAKRFHFIPFLNH